LTGIVAQLKPLNKSLYLFSATILEEDEKDVAVKLVHLNYLIKEDISTTFDAKSWSKSVEGIVGGKVRFLGSLRLLAPPRQETKCEADDFLPFV
jgi:hypothetical protein